MASVVRKPDSEEIVAFIQTLKNQGWIKTSERYWWPRFVFHHTDVRNAVKILKGGELLCRDSLDDGIPVDSASPGIIANTSDEVLKYVRLYFRPRTPTQYRMEGIRPESQLSYESHSPMPVFFLFDSEDILTRSNCEFTSGTHAGNPLSQGNSAEFLKSLPFKKIYHLGAYRQTDYELKYHKNAEVIIPERLDLSALKFLFCRSPAEKDTFMALLPQRPRMKYQGITRVASRASLYEKKWTFVETVELSSERIVVNFSPDSATPGPFHARFQLKNLDTGMIDTRDIEEFYTSDEGSRPLEISLPLGQSHYRFRLELDGCLAYQNDYVEDIPSYL